MPQTKDQRYFSTALAPSHPHYTDSYWQEPALITMQTIRDKYVLKLTASYKDELTTQFTALKKSLKTVPGVNCSATLSDLVPLSLSTCSTIKKAI